MKLLNRDAQIAIDVLEILRRNPSEYMPRHVLAEALGESEHYTHYVLGKLSAAGWVQTGRGKGGGYRYRPGSAKHTLHDLLALLQRSPVKPNPAHKKPTASDRASMALGEWLQNVRLDCL